MWNIKTKIGETKCLNFSKWDGKGSSTQDKGIKLEEHVLLPGLFCSVK